MNDKKEFMTYKGSGVDVEKGEAVAKNLEEELGSTLNDHVVPGKSGFKRFWRDENHTYVAGADGVGTKLKVGFLLKKIDTVGIDLVAMCINDIVRVGAEPMFFLDYLATGKLDEGDHLKIVSGIVEGCRRAGVPLLGGETAELPGFYSPKEFDLAGFAVGRAKHQDLIDGTNIKVGAALLGIESSGLHSNGYSLARKVLMEKLGLGMFDYVAKLRCTVGQELIRSTIIYSKPVLDLLSHFPGQVQGMAHVSGGGMPNKVPKCFPEGCGAVINEGSWPVHQIFSYIAENGPVAPEEMRRTFNMGIGMVMVINDKGVVPEISSLLLESHKLKSYDIGNIVAGRGLQYI
ncbi:MAG: phosphoribosylformylglycinamidine cyclo-ligase [Candidatus Woesearchaeota archaeon]